jgi:hypothetical protein
MKLFSIVAALIGLLALTSCGGGGGGGGAAVDTVASGVASKGIIRGGSIKVYALNADGSKGALLNKETTTDANGAYSANLGQYHGAILVEVSGSYTDEATGATSVPLATPLRAALDNVSGAVAVAVTPLTELAVQMGEDLATGKLRVADLAANNALVATAFKVDILNTMPADALTVSSATPKEKEHALVLAAFAQLMLSQGKDLHAVIAEIKDSLGADGKIAIPVAAQFQVALANFAKSPANQTGIRDISTTTLINIGGTSRTLTVSVGGTASLIGGVTVDVILPPGVTVKAVLLAGASKESVTDAALQAIGSAAGNALLLGSYTPATASARGKVTVGVISATGFAAGRLFTLQCDVAPDATPQSADFVVSLLEKFDTQSIALPGLSTSADLGL